MIVFLSIIAFSFLIFLPLIYILFFDLIPMISGGAFSATSSEDSIQRIVELASIKPDQKIAELGSGKGKLALALGKEGGVVQGYEINPFLVWISRFKVSQAGLENKIFIHYKSFWDQNLSDFDIVVIFGIGYMMPKMEKKIQEEVKPGSKIISNYFTFPNLKRIAEKGNIYLYIK